MGISLPQKQIKKARNKARKTHLDKLVNFEIIDFTKTRFKDETFTKIFSIESTCHAHNKLDFLKEAYGLLNPSGKIVLVAGFLNKRS